MGNRATLVIVDGDEPDIRYGHWAANDLSNHLVLGPDWTEHFVRHHPSGDWLDDAWTEGGLAMDLKRRSLLWFDNLTAGDLPWERLVTDLLSRSWPGWRVSWARRGVFDIAAAAGVDLGPHATTLRLVGDPVYLTPLRVVAGEFVAVLMHSHRAFDLPEFKQMHGELGGPPLDAIFLNRPYAQPTPSFADLRRVAEHLQCLLDEAA